MADLVSIVSVKLFDGTISEWQHLNRSAMRKPSRVGACILEMNTAHEIKEAEASDRSLKLCHDISTRARKAG